MSQFDSVSDRNEGWTSQPYGVILGSTFSDYKKDLINRLTIAGSNEGDADTGKSAADSGKDASAAVGSNDKGAAAYQYDAPTVADSSIFGNDVINPYAGFCRDDDIVHKTYQSKHKNQTYGMGRVYSEIYDSKQQVAYFQFGLPKYRNLRVYLQNACDSDMDNLNNTGNSSFVGKIGSLIKGGIAFAIELPWLPLEWGYKWITGLADSKVTEYFYFKETMLLYFEHVNTILAHLAVGMGLADNTTSPDESTRSQRAKIMQNGPDIFRILSAKSERFDASLITNARKSTEEMVKAYAVDDPPEEDPAGKNQTMLDRITDGLKKIWSWFANGVNEGWNTSVLDANKFIAFRVEKGSDNASESFSNTVGESSLQGRLNGEVQQHRERNLSAQAQSNDWLSGLATMGAKVKAAVTKGKEFLSNPTDAGGIIAYMAAGNGFFDLPQQWNGSQFSRSASMNIRLRAKTGGDPVSIYTSIMIPLACLLAGAMPRASGDSTYTSPFILRCWCRGMFAIPAGMIQSLSISRGDSEFGWSIWRQPTVISISMQIADLSPIMFLGLSNSGSAWQQAFRNNTKLIEYLNTLTGLGLKQRVYMFQQLGVNWKAYKRILSSRTFSPTYWGMRLGDSSFGRVISAFKSVKSIHMNNN